MKEANDILDLISTRIAHVLERPLMYGNTGAGVALLLHSYCSLKADILERRSEFDVTYHKVLAEEKCGSADFASRFQMKNPSASEVEIANYVVEQWRKIVEQIS